MASRYELVVTASSAKDLKNVNWRHGMTRPYAVLWIDPNNKCSTLVDDEGDTSPVWDQTFVIPLPPGSIEDATLSIHVVHAGSEEDTEPLIGSARLNPRDVLDEVGFGGPLRRSLQLKRPSGRPHGKVRVLVRVCVRETRYRVPDPYRAPSYGVPATGEYAPPAYAPPPPNPYYATAPPAGGYTSGAYNAPPPQYGQAPQYRYAGEPAAAYGQYGQGEGGESNFEGMRTALAVGVGVGVGVGTLAGLALAARFYSSENENDDDADEDEDEDEDGIGDDRPVEEESNNEAVGVGPGAGDLAGLALVLRFDSSEDDNDDDADEDENEAGIVFDADEIVDDGPVQEESSDEAVAVGAGAGDLAGLALVPMFDSSEDDNDDDADEDENETGIVFDADEIVDAGPLEEEGDDED